MFVLVKAALNQGFSTFVLVFYCQAAACLPLLPIAALRERMEVVKIRSSYGIAKVTGVAMCLAGVFVIAFFTGPSLSPVNHHHAFHGHSSSSLMNRGTWIKGTFLKLLGDMAWALWIVFQAALLKEYPNRMLVTATQCIFGTLQTLVVAAVAERDITRWKLRLDITLVAIFYSVWCMEMKGPVFLVIWFPLGFVFTMFCSSFFLGEVIHLGSILGGILLTGGLYSVLWAKSKEEGKTKKQGSSEVNAIETIEIRYDEKEEKKLEGDQRKDKEEHEEEASISICG
nr:unnamed protein product [Digitaria exilis]